MADLKLEPTGFKYCRRIMRGSEIVAFVMQYSNGLWALTDVHDKRLPGFLKFKSPKSAFNHFSAALDAETQREGKS